MNQDEELSWDELSQKYPNAARNAIAAYIWGRSDRIAGLRRVETREEGEAYNRGFNGLEFGEINTIKGEE